MRKMHRCSPRFAVNSVKLKAERGTPIREDWWCAFGDDSSHSFEGSDPHGLG